MSTPESDKAIRVRGARTHNLCDLDLDLPREAWTVVCGVSGSGKSSLVLDTLGAESRRRFVGTLPHALRGLETWPRPDVDRIEGLPPAVVAGFTSREPGPRRTLGTVTEITHALRALFTRVGIPHCPTCGARVEAEPREAITAGLLSHPPGTRIVLLVDRGVGADALADVTRDGFVRVRIAGGEIERLEDLESGTVEADDRVEVVVDRLVVKEGAEERFAASVDQSMDLGGGVLRALVLEKGGDTTPRTRTFAERPYCGACDTSWPALSTSLFNFNSPVGACPTCEGRGEVPQLDPEAVLPRRLRMRRVRAHLDRHLKAADRTVFHRLLSRTLEKGGLDPADRVADLSPTLRRRLLEGGPGRTRGLLALLPRDAGWTRLTTPRVCPACDGTRLVPFAAHVLIAGRSLPELEALTAQDLATWLDALSLGGSTAALAAPARGDLEARLGFLVEVGLGYLAPCRGASTLSGGELRRARLAAACAARMSGLLFLLDEPAVGLHPADRPALRRRLRALVSEGNTVVCVEHDPAALVDADHVLELGPGAGQAGGRVLDAGPRDEFLSRLRAPMARVLAAEEEPPRQTPRRQVGSIGVTGAIANNLDALDARFPVEALTCISGVSGAGKSSLLLEVLAPAARATLDRAPFPHERLARLEGMEHIERLSVASGSGHRHPNATPGTVLGVLGPIRRLFAATLEARARGWAPARFSARVRGGRCEACRGTGERRVALRDLPPLTVPCDLCDGTGFNRETLKVRLKGLSIADVQALQLEEAAALFRDLPAVGRPLAAATDVGLGYVPLGVPTSRLSGGEALRLGLAAALGRGTLRATLYLLDEPSAGLHPADVAHLTELLVRLTAEGGTVVAVEHHPHLLSRADHVVEVGPGAGPAGGRLVYEGPPAGLLDVPDSPTAASWGR